MTPWLTTAEAASLLGTSRATAWRWIHAGLIPEASLLRVGRRVLIARAWIVNARQAAA